MLKKLRRTTPYHINVNNVHTFFVRLIFVAAIDYKNTFTTKITRFMVLPSAPFTQKELLRGIWYLIVYDNTSTTRDVSH